MTLLSRSPLLQHKNSINKKSNERIYLVTAIDLTTRLPGPRRNAPR